MKRLCFIMMMLVAVSSFAQQKEDRRKPMKERAVMNMTAEEKAILKSKQLTLALDLTEKQQNDFQKLYTERAKDRAKMREEMKDAAEDGKLKEEAFERMNARLDKEIAFQQSIQKILSPDQYKLWKDSKRAERRNRMMAFKDHHRDFRDKHKTPK
ncbi:hypothetical protein INR75_01415 [Zunongwangia sp. SCSIO 43204]|uniref:hypothetical protein n=1 Tax=Zunongwangia sp. SCSIO 43204 TaxID=2779359 RepID=UPI001CA80775|nr:hypothetical protein [Zunongwangia sp. SCSIO 43204]UAB84719.1 hypothetical protein INR75_01415 [Zunongwangia sp. SCSIO 43204]